MSKVIYDKDGKPCRTCNSLLDFQAASGKVPKDKKLATPRRKDCPPDVNEIGRSSWTFLHSVAATYPETPSSEQQTDLRTFLRLFSKFYPCWYCGEDFEKYQVKNEPSVESQEKFGKWLCDAHNEVNVKLGKPKFDCNLWQQRWKDGWKDGSCD
ncbi:mitochondrial FAD-linked sulfhydryl oxidase Erv1p [[Candida] jaroonii]|uniref:Mitochondrial FAD-linked sulfhydryl oxidase Erv1p n=1 Tax=[Candida] jaroonii TaxID=467808 RepID=A0ACA9YD85_9ASCO|nr:mitochondrial FAD-linked sulfhydryl oxidase Erv1p [[Candida] jaroonii]